MSLADSGKAIGAVSRIVRDQLHTRLATSLSDVSVGKPEPAAGLPTPRLNLFLYELTFDPSLRNEPLDITRPAPLWIVLRYLLTAFDHDGDSDTDKAHDLLGLGLRTLQEISYLPLSGLAADIGALDDNPEALKITFDDANIDLLSKVMQGTDEKYRFCAAFQVRPVMIATGEPPSSSLLVGIDYTKKTIIGEQGIDLVVFPFGGPELTGLEPQKFEPGSTLAILGSGLGAADLSVSIGTAEAAVTSQSEEKLTCLVNGAIAGGAAISAGSQPISVLQQLRSGTRRQSNLLVGGLLPVLTSAVPGPITRMVPLNPLSDVTCDIVLNGVLLGTPRDEVYAALYQDGATVKFYDVFTFAPGPATPQTQMTLHVPAIRPGKYRLILRVNGCQAKAAPELTLVAP